MTDEQRLVIPRDGTAYINGSAAVLLQTIVEQLRHDVREDMAAMEGRITRTMAAHEDWSHAIVNDNERRLTDIEQHIEAEALIEAREAGQRSVVTGFFGYIERNVKWLLPLALFLGALGGDLIAAVGEHLGGR